MGDTLKSCCFIIEYDSVSEIQYTIVYNRNTNHLVKKKKNVMLL